MKVVLPSKRKSAFSPIGSTTKVTFVSPSVTSKVSLRNCAKEKVSPLSISINPFVGVIKYLPSSFITFGRWLPSRATKKTSKNPSRSKIRLSSPVGENTLTSFCSNGFTTLVVKEPVPTPFTEVEIITEPVFCPVEISAVP